MVEKIRFGGEWSVKKMVAAILFGAIIIVFVLWGVRPSTLGDASEGVAAIVNDRPIALADFRQNIEQREQMMNMRMNGLPEEQRRAQSAMLRQQVLEQMIMGEIVYQAANKKGIVASDGEVKDMILQIPQFQENGHFAPERYRAFLQGSRRSADDFEREIRKQIVTQRLQDLFLGASSPAQEELKRNRSLANFKANLRFMEIKREDFNKFSSISEAELKNYLAQHKAEIESYYKDNLIEFTEPEKYHARDLVIRADEKRSDAEAKKLADEVRKQLNGQNFAKISDRYNEDPGLKKKGGDLGELQHGSLMPEMERAVLALQPGQISLPLKIQGAYHLIHLVSKKESAKRSLPEVEGLIARKLMSRSRELEIVNQLRQKLEKPDTKEWESYLTKAGMKWVETGDFDLSSSVIPKIGESREIISLILKQGKAGGIIHQLVPYQNNFYVINVLGWKETPDKANDDQEGIDQMVALRKADGAFRTWIGDEEGKANIQRNLRLAQ